ncbi:hypothetical protein EVU91_01480 [Macrococcoides bohemicum]|uniref:hypothetical protein n=1 Tax=Macrococcoides bohemicum TaxID=1903056 RepID=UPI001059697C|nr:hypothetical protein [Macrococcus bohemicus]TDL40590.1 hypothetical protein EVU91_01480 [Macrococcus bohemicus]
MIKLNIVSLLLAFISLLLWQFVALFIPGDNMLIFGLTLITWLILLSVYMVDQDIKSEVR